jgi:hypothetical protein
MEAALQPKLRHMAKFISPREAQVFSGQNA